MSFIKFNNVSFKYPEVEGDFDENGQQIAPKNVFENFTGEIPGSFTSIIGPNGCGKSTFMLLSAGRLVPQQGSVFLGGEDVAALDDEKKNLLASFIYQNMEFDTNDKVSSLLEQVYSAGNYKSAAPSLFSGKDFFTEVKDVFELDSVMDHGLTEISKGENQRVLLAFSLLYGSRSVFMDEPLFAMEDRQKEAALDYLRNYSMKKQIPFYVSMHELDLSRKYAENVLLIKPNKDMCYGTPGEVMTNDELESAYGIPASMLKHQEAMTRENLCDVAKTAARIS